jgi:hypothetical protein
MEDELLGKSANQLWKESGTTLSFKDWIQREKEKGMLIPNKLINDSIALIKSRVGIRDSEISNVSLEQGTSKTVLGLNKLAIISSVLIIGGALAYNFYKKRK